MNKTDDMMNIRETIQKLNVSAQQHSFNDDDHKRLLCDMIDGIETRCDAAQRSYRRAKFIQRLATNAVACIVIVASLSYLLSFDSQYSFVLDSHFVDHSETIARINKLFVVS